MDTIPCTEGLEGRDLAVARLTNKIRFAADGAIVGGAFPLAGRALKLGFRYGIYKERLCLPPRTHQAQCQTCTKVKNKVTLQRWRTGLTRESLVWHI